MKQILLALVAVISLLPLTAQEQITTAYFPAVGDTLNVNQADLDWARTLDFQLDGGENLTWTFPAPQLLFEASNPVAAANNPEFPTADIVITTDVFDKNYYRFDGDTMNLVGLITRLDVLPSFALTTPADPPRATRRAGLTYEETFSATTSNRVTVSPDSLPPEALALIGAEVLAGVDSLRITTNSQRQDFVDAYGTVILGEDQFETIRERRREFIELRLEIKREPLPFVDVTNSVQIVSPQLAAFLGPQDTIDTYIWWNDSSKEAIARVGVGTDGQLVSMQYKRMNTTTSTEGPRLEQANLNLYPNPATAAAQFTVTGLNGGGYEVVIHNTLGRRIGQRSFLAFGNETSLTLDVSDYPSGLYLVTLQNQQGRILTTRRLKVR